MEKLAGTRIIVRFRQPAIWFALLALLPLGQDMLPREPGAGTA